MADRVRALCGAEPQARGLGQPEIFNFLGFYLHLRQTSGLSAIGWIDARIYGNRMMPREGSGRGWIGQGAGVNLRLLDLFAVAVVLFAASAASAQQSQTAQERKGSSPAVAASPIPNARSDPSTIIAGTSVQRPREKIAAFLEAHKWFREYDDDGAPKLTNAKIAGPLEVGGMVSPKGQVYCVKADVMLAKPILFVRRSSLIAVVTFATDHNGVERILGRVIKTSGAGPDVCFFARYTAFSELELVRAKRRQALGKADS